MVNVLPDYQVMEKMKDIARFLPGWQVYEDTRYPDLTSRVLVKKHYAIKFGSARNRLRVAWTFHPAYPYDRDLPYQSFAITADIGRPSYSIAGQIESRLLPKVIPQADCMLSKSYEREDIRQKAFTNASALAKILNDTPPRKGNMDYYVRGRLADLRVNARVTAGGISQVTIDPNIPIPVGCIQTIMEVILDSIS